MCGIAGILSLDGAPVAPARVRRMAAAMRHRGPDDEGYVAIDPRGEKPAAVLGGPGTGSGVRGAGLPYTPAAEDRDPADRSLVLGQVRLAIIDLSAGGHQPLTDDDGAVWITFGGEIFNYVELRAELAALGHRFRSASDTEVLVHGYRQWGVELFRRLNGMWALALWDAPRRRLVVSRDRFGIKPFYYRFDGREFAFASELRGLLALGDSTAPDPVAVFELIAGGRVDASERTFFAGIRSLPAAHFAVVGEDGLTRERFWDLPVPEGGGRREGEPERKGRGEEAAALAALLTDAVRLRLRSDVPVGTCLSGGIDSSTIVSLGTRLLGGPMDAFSVAYAGEGEAFDERAHMEAVVSASGARHHLVMPAGDLLLDELAQVTEAQEEPAAGAGIYSQWHVMRLAGGTGAKVLLDGQGGDELFGGYFAFYFPLRLRDLVRSRRLGSALALARAAIARGHSPLEVAARSAEPWIPRALFRAGRRWLGAGDWARVLAPEVREAGCAAIGKERPVRRRFPDHLSSRMDEDLNRLLLPSLLRYEDRNSMAFSIEARVPFLDYRVVELAFSLPPASKIDHLVTKRVLREAMRGIVPDSILARTDKRGFETPVVRWLTARHAGWLEDTLVRGRAVERGLIVKREVARELSGWLARPRGPGHHVWRLLSLELWLRAFFEGGRRT